MDQTVVTATTGRAQGSRSSRRLRAEGILPGVVYGLGKEPIPVAVNYIELRDAMKTDAGMNTVISLDVEGSTTETVIVRSVQRHPIRRDVTHADFMRVDPDQAVRVKVPIRLIGEATQVTDDGGLIEQKMFEIEVEVSPLNIPSEIVADISAMTLDDAISVGDLAFPPGAVTTVAEDVSVVAPVVSRAAKMMLDEELAEGEDAEAGDGEDGDGDDADADDADAE